MRADPLARRRPRGHTGRTPTEIAVFEATERLLGERPLHEIAVAQIIATAGLSRATFYHYFASKHDVVVALLQRILAEHDGNADDVRISDDGAGADRAGAMDAGLRATMQLWSGHGAVICAIVENMHAVPELRDAWRAMLEHVVRSVSDHVRDERERFASGAPVPAETIATVVVCGAERTFYVASRGLEPRLPDVDRACDALVAMALAMSRASADAPARARESRAADSSCTPASRGRATSAATNATEAAILRATNGLLLEHALEDLSVARILSAAHVSRATFYFYFTSKEDVFAALLGGVTEDLVLLFEELLSSVDAAGDRADATARISAWLRLEPADLVVIQNAIREWPRRPEIRRLYLGGVERLTTALAAKIDADRAPGVALPGIAGAELAATLLWTI